MSDRFGGREARRLVVCMSVVLVLKLGLTVRVLMVFVEGPVIERCGLRGRISSLQEHWN